MVKLTRLWELSRSSLLGYSSIAHHATCLPSKGYAPGNFIDSNGIVPLPLTAAELTR